MYLRFSDFSLRRFASKHEEYYILGYDFSEQHTASIIRIKGKTNK
jgi:hypothetical protein